MPAMMTSADVLKMNVSEELLGIINEVIKVVPEMQFFEASPVVRNAYKSLTVVKLPETSFRDPEGDRAIDSATLANRDTACKYLDASWVLKKAVAEQSDWTKEKVIALQQMTHLQSAFLTLSQQIWYGVDNDPAGFIGLKSLVEAVPEMDLNASSATAGLSSVYAVRTGLDSCQLAWGSEGKFDEGEIVKQWITTTAGRGYWSFAQCLGGWVGLQVTSKWACAKYSGFSTGTDQGVTDDHLYKLLAAFPTGMQPDAFFMSRRSQEQLRSSRTAVNATGAPAPTPTEVGGVRIIVTDAISNNEEEFEETP